MFTPFLLRAVALAGGLSLTVAGGFAAYNLLSGSGAGPDQGSMVPVAFADASGRHALLADSGRPADLQAGLIIHDRTPNVEAAEQAAAVAPATAPPVMTAPDAAEAAAPANLPLPAAAAPANVPPPAAVTIVRTAPAPIAVRASGDDRRSAQVDRDDEHGSKQKHGAQRASGDRGHGE